MERIKYFIRRYKDLFLLFLLSLVPMLWYRFDTRLLITSSDVGYPYNPFNIISNRVYLWNSSSGLGVPQLDWSGTILYHGLEAFLTYLSGSLFIGQQIYVVIWFFLPMLAIYLAIKRLPQLADKPYFALFAALLFQFNFFQLSGWKVLWRTRFSIYTALPLLLVLFIDYLEGKRSLIRTALFSGLIIFFLNGGGALPLFGSVILLYFITILFYLIMSLRRNRLLDFLKRNVYFFVSAFVITFLLSAYWVLPFLYLALSVYSSTFSGMGGVDNIVSWANVVHRNASIVNLLRLQGMDVFELSAVRDYLDIYMTNPFFLLISFIWPILAFSAIFWARKPQQKKYILLFSLLALLSLIFTAGSHQPFRSFFVFILKTVPTFPIFRTAIHKFGMLFWFANAVLIAFSLSSLVEKIAAYLNHKKIATKIVTACLAVIFICLIIAWNFPILGRSFFRWNPPLTTLERVPNYIFDFGQWADGLKTDTQRMLLTPALNKMWLSDVYKWGYFSLQSVPYLVTVKSTIATDASNQGDKGLMLNVIFNSIKEKKDDLKKIVPLLSLKYFLQRNDAFYNLDWILSENPQKFDERLNQMDDLKLEKQFDQWKVYAISDKYYLPHFFIPTNTSFINGDTYDFVNLLSLLPPNIRASYYWAPVDKTSYTPQLDFANFFIIPGNPCCFVFNKTSKKASSEYKSLIDKEGIKTVFTYNYLSWEIPKEGKYTVLLRSGTPFTNGKIVTITVDKQIIQREITSEDRENVWINFGEIDLSEGDHTLLVSADGDNIRTIKAGDIIFKYESVVNQIMPNIDFYKVNSTKYKIHISEAKTPFTLIFSETYDPKWKLFVDNSRGNEKNSHSHNIIASYFDGQIKEREHSNTFLYKDIFETLFLKQFPDKDHVQINGYANAWRVDPKLFCEDKNACLKNPDGSLDFDLVVEYIPQRLFYLGSIISVVVLLGSVGYLTFRRYRGIFHNQS